MRSDPVARQAVSLGLLLTAALLAALLFKAPPVVALRLYVLALAAVAVLAVVAAALAGRAFDDGPRWWRGRRPSDRPERLRQLEEIEHAAAFALSTAFDVHYRLRPHLARVANHRLAARGSRPAQAAELLGPDLWELVRPDREAPADRHGRGIDLARLAAMVERLDTL